MLKRGRPSFNEIRSLVIGILIESRGVGKELSEDLADEITIAVQACYDPDCPPMFMEPGNASMDDAPYVSDLIRVIDAVAPDEPIVQDERGGCVWCGESDGGFGSSSDPEHHDGGSKTEIEYANAECGWASARRMLARLKRLPDSRIA